MSTASKSKTSHLLASLQHGRVYRSTKAHDLFYRIEQIQAGNGIVIVSSFNPNPQAYRRYARGRAIRAASLAAYDLVLLAPEDEPEGLLSKEGEAHLERKRRDLATRKAAQPQAPILAEEAAQTIAALLEGGAQLSLVHDKIHLSGANVLPEHVAAVRALKSLIVVLLKRRPAWLDAMEQDARATREMLADLGRALGVIRSEVSK